MPKNQDAEASAHNEVPVSGHVYERNTQKTPWYVRKMDIDTKNIDEYDKNTWRTIYEEIDTSYLGEVELLSKIFLDNSKKHLNCPQNIETEINNNIKNHIIGKFILPGGYDPL